MTTPPLGKMYTPLVMRTPYAPEFLSLVELLPKRVLEGVSGPYLERYTLSQGENGQHVYLHHILRADEDEELHCHPWSAVSTILSGSYVEERRDEDDEIEMHLRSTGDSYRIDTSTYHRIAQVTGDVWTLFITSPYVKSWSFWDRHTHVETPWRDFLRAKGLHVP